MKAIISPDRKTLTITVTPAEQAELRSMPESAKEAAETGDGYSIYSDVAMYEFLEPITANSELEWIDPSETGDLTDAPMLGIRDPDSFGDIGDPNENFPVEERWAFMDYQISSLLEVLRDKGSAVLVS